MLLANGKSVPNLAPQALAELVPQMAASFYYPDSMGLELERQYALYGEIYKCQPWVRTVVDKRAMAVARLPINVWDINGDTRKIDYRSKYAALIANPCEFLDNFAFWTWVQSTIDIYGETYLAMVKDENNFPTSFMPMHPSRVAIKRDPKTNEYLYTFQAGSGLGGELVSFPQSDVVPFRLFNPNKLERGLSRLESLKSTIFAEDSSRNATAAMWGNSGRPNIVLSSEKALGDAGRSRLTNAFKQAHAGSSNAGKALVLEDGVTASAFQLTAVEMQFIESRHLNREEVCSVMDIAPPIVHILDKATFCLPADAQVSTEQGPKDIIDVKPGDRVWSFNGESLELAPVSWSGQTGELPLFTVRTASRTLRATGNHPVLVAVADGYRYVPVEGLRVGDVLVSAHGVGDGMGMESTSVIEISESREPVRVYDLTVPGNHSFVADGLVVHNSNISAQMRAFYRDTMSPPLEFIQSVMDKYVGSYWSRKNEMKFAVDDVIRGDWETRTQSGQAAVNSGGMTPNEYRDLMGLNRSSDPRADELFANSAMQPLGAPAEQIRLQGEVDGATPDGVAASPLSTPVASADGVKPPTSVPALPRAAVASRPSGGAVGAPPGPASPLKHLRAVKGALGRNQSVTDVAVRLYEAYPDEWQDILAAVEVAIRERVAR